MIRGVPVVILSKTQVGADAFGAPVYEFHEEVVEDVLIAPSTADDIVTSQDLTGKKAVYTLAIPKNDTHVWEDQIVRFFGVQWHVFGFSLKGIDANIPLRWNMKVMVERYE